MTRIRHTKTTFTAGDAKQTVGLFAYERSEGKMHALKNMIESE